MTDSFLRQRRNLFVTNTIFLLCYYAEVQISKLSIAGIRFESFDNAKAIYYFLWVAWAYFLYRYFVYFIEDERETFSKIWIRELETRVTRKLKSIAFSACEDLNVRSGFSYYHMKRNNWTLKFQAYDTDEDGEDRILNLDHKIKRTDVFVAELMSILYFSFFTPVLTNYVLGAAVSLFVFYQCGLSAWEGGLFQLFT